MAVGVVYHGNHVGMKELFGSQVGRRMRGGCFVRRNKIGSARYMGRSSCCRTKVEVCAVSKRNSNGERCVRLQMEGRRVGGGGVSGARSGVLARKAVATDAATEKAAAEASVNIAKSKEEKMAVKLVERAEREYKTWCRQCKEVRFKAMQEDSLLFDRADVTPMELLGVSLDSSDEEIEKKFQEIRSNWSGITDEELDRASWETLQLYEQELLLLANPNYDQSFFFYKLDGNPPAAHEYSLIKRARDIMLDKDRKELFLGLREAAERGKEWEEQIKDVLKQIPEESTEYPDPMFEGEDYTLWESR